MRTPALLLVLLLLVLASRTAHADEIGRAKAYFRAGAAAYEAGDYLAAIQALDAAYELTPLPAIAFSLAQAERRQYFVSRDRAHLERAVELFRVYLREVPSGGRRSDATDALAQIEPLLLATAAPGDAEGTGRTSASSTTTRLLVTAAVAKAQISLDGAAPVPSPLITEVKPGKHSLRVEAQGHFPAEREVVAVEGALVPVELSLRARPAVVILRTDPSNEVYVDGQPAGKAREGNRLELPGGRHTFTFARKGHQVRTVHVDVEAGTTRELDVKLPLTTQRTASYVLFIASGATFFLSSLSALAAAAEEERAREIADRQASGNIEAEDVDEYDEAIRRRNQLRAGAIAGFAITGGTLVTAICLHEFDHPNLRENTPSPRARGFVPSVAILPERGGGSVFTTFSF